jgi:hypothetical protein
MNANTVFSSRYRHCGVVVLFLASAVGAAQPALAQYDPSAQFSATMNPNGVWSYGFENVPLGSPFTLLPIPIPVASLPGPFIDSWQSVFSPLAVLHNGTNVTQTVTTAFDSAIYDPGMLALHPGPNDQFSVVQWSAPVNGFYSIQGTFEGIDTSWTTSNVYLLYNNSIILGSGTVTGFGPAFEVTLTSPSILLNAGDTLEYVVGGGPIHDTTALIDAQVSAAAGVPEPSSLVSLAIACVAVIAWAWRQRMARARRWTTCTA